MDLLKRCSGSSICAFTKRCQRVSLRLMADRNLLPIAFEPLAAGSLVRRIRPLERCCQRRLCHTRPPTANAQTAVRLRVPQLVQFNLDRLQSDVSETLITLHRLTTTSSNPEFLSDSEKELHRMAKYYFEQSGKMFRPSVCLMMAAACSPSTSDSIAITEEQYKIAVIAEMVHTASLVHDDVIDQSDTRRNKPTVNAKWGNKTAVLVGDYILAKATQLLCSIGDAQVISLLAQIIEDLVRGEFMQMGVRNSSADDRFMHYMIKTFKKTASLFAYSCKSVALLAGCPESTQQAAFEYGRNLGLAFQLIDDLLDFVSSTSDLGKPAATDLKLGLATAPVLFAARQHKELDRLVMRRFSQPGDVETAWELVMRSDGLQRTKDLAETHVDSALQALTELPGANTEFGEALRSAALVQMNRER